MMLFATMLLSTASRAAAKTAASMGCAPTDDATECAALKAIYDATDGPNWRKLTDPAGPVFKWDGSSYCTWYVGARGGAPRSRTTTPPCSLTTASARGTIHPSRRRRHGILPPRVLSGVICDPFTKKVSQLYLESLQLKGTLPDAVGDFDSIVELHLWNNKMSPLNKRGGLSGTLPAAVAKLTTLNVLEIQINQMVGAPPDLSALAKNLHVLKMDKNAFNGTLPSSYCAFASTATAPLLTDCDLGGNSFVCPLPSACAATIASKCALNCSQVPPAPLL